MHSRSAHPCGRLPSETVPSHRERVSYRPWLNDTSGACSTLVTTLSKRDTSNRSECECLTDE
jgi:hypothetical protein